MLFGPAPYLARPSNKVFCRYPADTRASRYGVRGTACRCGALWGAAGVLKRMAGLGCGPFWPGQPQPARPQGARLTRLWPPAGLTAGAMWFVIFVFLVERHRSFCCWFMTAIAAKRIKLLKSMRRHLHSVLIISIKTGLNRVEPMTVFVASRPKRRKFRYCPRCSPATAAARPWLSADRAHLHVAQSKRRRFAGLNRTSTQAVAGSC